MKTIKRLFSIVVSLALVGAAFAQPGQGGPPPGPGGPGGPGRGRPGGSVMLIIRMNTVQSHLQLTRAQIDQINALRPPQPGGGGQGGGGGRPPQDPLKDLLNANQLSRVKQLALQFDAPMTLLDRRIAGELNLTEEQRQDIDEAIRENMPRPEPGGDRPTFAQMQAAKARAFTAAYAVLNGTQKTKWGELTGAAFTNWVEPPRP
ncbi:MAG TPA: hypothetical protein PLH94_04770 [Fimbriimonadaceae bacterium]|mgnify:CR=1 FL=1|nr:hypothetical protein [Fimbriimonadaceae bacterium]